MAKGFYISKTLAVVGILFSVAAMATVIGLSVALSQEKAKNENSIAPGDTNVGTTASDLSRDAVTMQPPNEIWNRYRLPNSLIPEHYDIELQPYLTKNAEGLYIFKGKSSVSIKCLTATNLILIHSNKLNYTLKEGHHVSLEAVDGSNPPSIQKAWLEVPTQYLVVQLNRNLEAGKTYKISGEFTGELADDLAGFYRSEYKEDNETRVIATTQMQPTGARKTFPCFDEPAMKATFNITMIYQPQYEAISNMPNISTTSRMIDGKQWIVTTFDQTPRMSTYLLAFIISDFGNVEKHGSKPQIRIWARKKAIRENQGEYALNVTGTILNYFDRYYNVSYPLPKSDQIALPDFNAGAMENWGLITYRESALLYDNEISSIGNKERVLTVIAHELAHQWFGNLVTLRWWNDLWLNEGFASYVEYLGADIVQKTWNIKDVILLNEIYRVMEIDALSSSHPLSSKEEEVNTPAEINEVFDPIAYSKGASVIRMLAEFLTEPVFKAGLHSYLNAFKYDNAVYSDLWTHLQKEIHSSSNLPKSIQGIMDTWILQMGFPVVTVDTSSGKITQKHFLLDPDSKVDRPSDFNYLWIVPISWMKNGVVQPGYHWLQNSEEINDNFKTSDWVLANINVEGYYRVNYDSGNRKKLLQQLQTNHLVIPVMNRAQIISDAFSLARAKYINTTAALETTKFLINDTEYMPWQTAVASLDYFKLMFDRTDVYGSMKKYMKKQVSALFQHFKEMTDNWTTRPSGLMEQYNEVTAISLACTNDIQECQTLASDLFNNWMNNSSYNPIHPNLKVTVYCSAIARGGEKEWDFAWEMFQKATVAAEADKLRAALACSTQPWILNRYLQYSLDPIKIRKQDAISTIIYTANNVVGQSFAWDFVRANWKEIFAMFGESSFTLTNLITRVTQRFSTEFDLQQLEQFKLDNQDTGFGSASRAMEQALEKTKANIRWVQENKEAVHTWFNAEIKSSL
ncbi:aminopeptidase Ey [Microcaecilia unicolor]|uniref:Aminopeptidase n=1 Tax=Microcaecilia unicolor TaxID=1415580 RepID=A0A6P7WWM0_9AMPH|nr:aminopeptidase Ey-like [Microcaecilia unicolor]XP_030045539.1 aminopeptidase Ey-like [Microcaecilia unicolor]XP_030045540.1 aminopeptidase Ey-like [Microcaecilia unicolor]XP_030045541.1 aminopeptidase Ey-like [Microcaecilia unicolor]XP_030045543.1 aminopeptidase Ey-like [Microcaecilia unicolor]